LGIGGPGTIHERELVMEAQKARLTRYQLDVAAAAPAFTREITLAPQEEADRAEAA
jgi:hypothetical protein